jgi:hypothetical protein
MTNMISGKGSSVAGAVTVAPVTVPDAHLAIAQQLLTGARVLAGGPNCAVTLAFVCAQAAECLFKAFLSWKGVPETDLKDHHVRHDLVALHAKAVARGLTIDPKPPLWLALLSDLHKSPFRLRYPVGLNGFVLPASEPMLADLEILEGLVKGART